MFITLKTFSLMAKQSGIHQIKGKIGEHSYYRQTGVSGGLIRSINQGLSARVKNDEAFANTRLNNQEFGAAANVSALLGKCVNPKFRPMILPFSQSKMAKEILKVAREHTQNWGQRVVTSDDTARLCEILSSISKRDFSEIATISFSRPGSTKLDVTGGYSVDQSNFLAAIGATGLTIIVTQFDLATGQWIPYAQEMSTGYLYTRNSVPVLENDPVREGTVYTTSEDMVIAPFVPEANHSGHQILVAVAMPIREINEVPHILQEYCAFTAVQMLAEP